MRNNCIYGVDYIRWTHATSVKQHPQNSLMLSNVLGTNITNSLVQDIAVLVGSTYFEFQRWSFHSFLNHDVQKVVLLKPLGPLAMRKEALLQALSEGVASDPCNVLSTLIALNSSGSCPSANGGDWWFYTAIEGLARSARIEIPTRPIVLIDIQTHVPAMKPYPYNHAHWHNLDYIQTNVDSDELAIRNDVSYFPRLSISQIANSKHPEPPPAPFGPNQSIVQWCAHNTVFAPTGGLGNLGLVVSRWLVDEGSTHLLLL